MREGGRGGPTAQRHANTPFLYFFINLLKPTTVEPAGNHSLVILVAEDVILNMLLVTTILKQIIPQVRILEAKNGKDAVNVTISNNPDLILMDIQMPEMSGLEATAEIRQYEKSKNRRIPIIAITAGAVKGEKERCFEADMDDFLTKPIDRDSLRKILEKHLDSSYSILSNPV